MNRQDILDYSKSLACLPTLDKMTDKLSILLHESTVSFTYIAKIVKYDPGLSSKIISASNSAWYNRGVPVKTLNRAMEMLGLAEVKNILTCTLFHEGLLKKMGFKKKEVFDLWKHSLLVAFAAKRSARTTEQSQDEAFTAGLLHDIGKTPFLLNQDLRSKMNITSCHHTCDKEQKQFGTDHAEIGFFMATEWKLPEAYRSAIRFHHEEVKGLTLATLVREADMLVNSDSKDEEIQAQQRFIIDEAQKVIELFSA